MSWGDGDDWVWQFRQVGDNVQVVRRNVRFFADKGSPEEKAVDFAYTDSVLFSLPILTKGPSGGLIVELTGIFLAIFPRFQINWLDSHLPPIVRAGQALKALPTTSKLKLRPRTVLPEPPPSTPFLTVEA